MRAAERFGGNCIERLREAIEDAGGNEVFAAGWLDEGGLVSRIKILARGNETSVPALLKNAEMDDPGSLPDVFIHNHPSGFLTPSDNDLVISGRAGEAGLGAYITDNAVEKVYVVAEPVRRRQYKALEAGRIIRALEPGGAVAKRLPAYEIRESQLNLMKLIVKAFNGNAVAAAEAGTGVGKSFAYLLPSVRYALDNRERIVVSTATITLQQQLFDKDIPLVLSALSPAERKQIKAVLMKGRGNYLCRRRLTDALMEPLLDEEEYEELRRIAAWVETTKSGSHSDLSFLPQEGIWSRICSEADMCMGLRCPERERCFVLALRKEAADAKLVVVNHHLLFADLAARHEGAGYDVTVVLPPYRRVIIDEAHTMEGAATDFFSKTFSRPGLARQLGRLYRRRRAKRSGLLLRLADICGSKGGKAAPLAPQPSLKGEGSPLDEAAAAMEGIRDAMDVLDQLALALCGEEGVFRLCPRTEEGAFSLASPLTGLRKKIDLLVARIREMLENIHENDQDDPAVWETKSILRRLETVGSICLAFVEYREREKEVLWIEKRGTGADAWTVFSETPVDVAPGLDEALFRPNKTVICTSATLTISGSFNYWAGRNGAALDPERETMMGIFPSPFPYSENVLLAVPTDAPLPDEASYQEFVDYAALALTLAAGGSALILFTSYLSLKSAYNAAQPELQRQGIRCLKQGDDDRARLLAAFLEDRASVLFATDSFWEGVDAPGDTLRLVILCRLPFRTPKDPVFEARREAVEKYGGNAFMELSLPESVMKFKQGFGRLMRRSSDRGVIAVLDGRLLKKRYGEHFLRSLPETRTCFMEFESIVRNTERFLFP
ncbi:MAG: ATP-dependent DNA helicase DinG [Treponema sp.]|jgi:ATP-dependent DNA helicase DinG|nr:ATP-dependent DNA helicase DinG [Treponema sp.]